MKRSAFLGILGLLLTLGLVACGSSGSDDSSDGDGAGGSESISCSAACDGVSSSCQRLTESSCSSACSSRNWSQCQKNCVQSAGSCTAFANCGNQCDGSGGMSGGGDAGMMGDDGGGGMQDQSVIECGNNPNTSVSDCPFGECDETERDNPTECDDRYDDHATLGYDTLCQTGESANFKLGIGKGTSIEYWKTVDCRGGTATTDVCTSGVCAGCESARFTCQ